MSNYNTQLQSNNTDLQAILNTINELPEAGGEQATPVISVNSSNGLITATAGTKSSTHQLAFQPAKTITPSTTSQIAVSSGYYTGGNITVAGDSNLVAENIKSGVSIFGVSGTLDGGGNDGGDAYAEADSLITMNMMTYDNSRVSEIGIGAFAFGVRLKSVSFINALNIGQSAFHYCAFLTTANFPACTSIGNQAFMGCLELTTISFPACITIGVSAFYNCQNLSIANFPVCTTIGKHAFNFCSRLAVANFPACTTIGSEAFNHCTGLSTASFPAATAIGNDAFYCCYNLKSLYLLGYSVCKLSNSNAFTSTPIGGYSTSAGTYGSIYVPASLLTSYQTATNWTYFSSRFVGI